MIQTRVGIERECILIELDKPIETPYGTFSVVVLLPEVEQTYMLAENYIAAEKYVKEWEEDSGLRWIEPVTPGEKRFKFPVSRGLWSEIAREKESK